MFANILFVLIHVLAVATCLVVTFAPSTSIHPAIRIIYGIMSVALIGLSIFTASFYLLQQQP